MITTEERKTRELKMLFKPNLNIRISFMSDEFRYSVTHNQISIGSGFAESRQDSEKEIDKLLSKIKIDKISREKILYALDLDGQAKILRDIAPNSTLNVYVG